MRLVPVSPVTRRFAVLAVQLTPEKDRRGVPRVCRVAAPPDILRRLPEAGATD